MGSLFYLLKELTDLHGYSKWIKTSLYDYVLNIEPSRRSTAFSEEIQFVVNGLLDTPLNFTLLGQVKLTKGFVANLAITIYSYIVIFNQFSKKMPSLEASVH